MPAGGGIHPISSEVDAFKRSHGVATTPQTFIDGERIGGFDDLQEFFRSHESA